MILLINGCVNSKQFCRAFYDNNYRIDFLFRRVFKPKDSGSSHNIVIGDQFWTVNIDGEANTLSIESEEGRPAPAFASGKVVGAAYLKLDNEFTLLFNQELNSVQHLTISDNDRDPVSMNFTNDGHKELQNPSKSKPKPDIVYANPFTSSNTVDMVTKNGTKLSYDSFRVNQNLTVFTLEPSQTSVSPWSNFDTNGKDVMAVSAQSSKDGDAFLVLLKESYIVWWCLVNQDGTVSDSHYFLRL